jgi:hypothetical protein
MVHTPTITTRSDPSDEGILNSDRSLLEYLDSYTALRSLRVNDITLPIYPLDPLAEERPNPLQWVKGVVQSILDVPHLQEIVLRVSMKQNIADVDWNPWEEFDRIFDGHPLTELKKVEFDILPNGNGMDWRDCRSKVADVLNVLRERKLLVIS